MLAPFNAAEAGDLVATTLGAVAMIVAFAVLANLARRNPPPPDDIRPNQLLTRWPIEFWTGPRSLFYFASYWNSLPTILGAHGHDVRVIRLPWREPRARRAMAQTLLARPASVHLILDRATAAEFADLLLAHPPRSVTIPSGPSTSSVSFQQLCFQIHLGIVRLRRPGRPLPAAAALGLDQAALPAITDALLGQLRRQAEEDWFPMSSPGPRDSSPEENRLTFLLEPSERP